MGLFIVVIGIVAGVLAGVYGIQTIDSQASGEVLSQHIELVDTPPQPTITLSLPPPSPPSTPTLTPTPSPRPTSTPKPTPSSTPNPTLSSAPPPTIIPSPPPTVIPSVSPSQPISPATYPAISAPSDLEPLFLEFSLKYGVDINLLKKIAKCESNFNRGVVSPNGLYAGLFQFGVPLWTNQRNLMGLDSNPDLRFGARESIETAAYVISRWGTNAWPACSQ